VLGLIQLGLLRRQPLGFRFEAIAVFPDACPIGVDDRSRARRGCGRFGRRPRISGYRDRRHHNDRETRDRPGLRILGQDAGGLLDLISY